MIARNLHPPTSIRQLRYSFDSWQQAQAHIHSVEGRTLLFYPHEALDIGDAERVLLEISFGDSDQQLALSAKVVARGEARGVWLELFAARLFDELEMALDVARRSFRRISTDRMVRVRKPGQAAIGRLIDLGLGGASIAHLGGAWPKGTEVTVEFFERLAPLHGRVAWSERNEIGLEFVRGDARTRTAVDALFFQIMQSWDAAPDVRHPSACRCQEGGENVDPLAPRSARKRFVDAR